VGTSQGCPDGDDDSGEDTALSTTSDTIDTAVRPLAVVTGASSGIGRELARQFTNNGFDLVVAAEDEELAQVAVDLERAGAEVRAEQVDYATREGVERSLLRSPRPTARWLRRRSTQASACRGASTRSICPTTSG
jgi:uncharacterized protein YbjT (DUF2867 family)